jgi:hypothetical protein
MVLYWHDLETLRRPHRALLTLFALSGTLLFVLVAGQLALQAAVTPRACAEIGGTPSFKATGGFTCNYADGSAQHCYFGGFCTDVAAPVRGASTCSSPPPTARAACSTTTGSAQVADEDLSAVLYCWRALRSLHSYGTRRTDGH